MKQAVVRMTLEGATPDPLAVGLEQLPGKVNYLRGNDPGDWQTNVPTYDRVRYEGAYPGIDLVYYGHERQLEYDFIVAPGADPDMITLEFEGAESVDLDAAGDLVLATAAGPVRFRKPVVYQERDGSRQSVAANYLQKGTHRIGFGVTPYDVSRPLIIDPVLSYSTYLGGSGQDRGFDVAVDCVGAAYVTGVTTSPDFSTKPPFQPHSGDADAFAAELTADGTALVDATYIGGSEYDSGSRAVDTTGAAYVSGWTRSNGNTLEGVWTGSTQIQGPFGSPRPSPIPPLVFGFGTTAEFKFTIDLRTPNPFRFFVNLWGAPRPPGASCS